MNTATQNSGLTKTEAIAKIKNQFGFSVDKFPLSGPDNMATPYYGLFRSDNHQVVAGSSVSARYVPHTTDDVVAMAEAATEVFDNEIDVQCHFRDGHYLTLAPSKEYRREIFSGNRNASDSIFPRVILKAGYDGEAFSATLGYYRDLCRNMARISTVKDTCVRIHHTSGLRGRIDDLIQTFETIKGSWDRLYETVAQMNTRDVVLSDFLNEIYGQPEKTEGASVTIHRNRTEAIFKRLQRERFALGLGSIPSDFKVTAWEAYNAVQGYVQHDARRNADYNNSFDRILLSMNDKAVRKAEALALAT